jgi:hypothetical protein
MDGGVLRQRNPNEQKVDRQERTVADRSNGRKPLALRKAGKMGVCLSLCGRVSDKGTAVSRQDPVTGAHSSKRSASLFVNADGGHDGTPLLKTDAAVVQISDSSEGSFDQEMISKLLAEQPGSDEDP